MSNYIMPGITKIEKYNELSAKTNRSRNELTGMAIFLIARKNKDLSK